jgi:hypothetical protein
VTDRFPWWWWLLAFALAGAAIAESASYAAAVPLATAAVAVALLALVDSIWRLGVPRPPPALPPPVPYSRIREWWRGGRMGREEIVLLLDGLTRRSIDPRLPVRPASEMAPLLRLSPTEWLSYVSDRLARIEGGR